MTEAAVVWMASHVELSVPIVFFLLLAAGLNVPISEDLVNVAAASLAAAYPYLALPLLVSTLLGAYGADQLSYLLGRYGGGLVASRAKRVASAAERLSVLLKKNSALYLIAGRFIPFGFRNLLHMSCGLLRLSYFSYLVYDGIAVVLTTGMLFAVVYRFGTQSQSIMRYFGLVAGVLLLVSVLVYLIVGRRMLQGRPEEGEEP